MRKLFRNNLAIIIINMSSRSLAAARARRAGENAPPVSGNRPVTSTGSAAAFSNMNQPPNNVRIARQSVPQQQQPTQRQQSAAFQQVQQSQQQSQSSQPFSKLSISDAVGLITLRLGRLEQWVIESEHEGESTNGNSSTTSNLPENSKIIDNSVFLSIIDRLDAVEKDKSGTSSETITKLTQDVAKFTEQLTKVCDESNKQIITISKHTEQLFKFERELVETKDILKTFMIKYDSFVSESNERFADYDLAMSELEKNIQSPVQTDAITETEGTAIDDIDLAETTNIGEDLKNMVKLELSVDN